MRATAAALAALLSTAGCATQGDDAGDLEFGLGGKADQICSPDADLCWDSDDSAVMRELLRRQDDVMLGATPKESLAQVVAMARGLEHKLTDDEIDNLERTEQRVEALPATATVEDAVDLSTEIQEQVLRRIVGTYYVAHMVPAGQVIDSGGKFDEADGLSDEDANQVEGLSEGMKESLQLLRDSGAIGITIAEMYKFTGVLDRDYDLVNAVNFGEFDATTGRIIPTGISREAKADAIIAKYRRAAGFVGAGAGVVGLIPIAGIPLSVSGETVALFKLHAQMSFEIASVYGWDIKDGTNLYLMSTMFMTDGLLAEAGDVIASNLIVPLLAKKLAAKFGLNLGPQLIKQISQRSIKQLLGFFSKKAQQKLAQEVVEGTAKGVANQLLGWATLGLTVAASAAIDWIATDALGRHAEVLSKRWLHDLLMEGTTYLSKPKARDCAFRALSAVAWADGDVNEREQRLYMAYLAKPYAVDEQSWFFLSSDERVRQSQVLASFPEDDTAGGVERCLGDFEDSLAQHRVSLLGHVYAMAQVDAQEHLEERTLYDGMRAGLDGDGFFDGDEIDHTHMDYVERSIFITVNPGVIEVAEEHAEAVDALLVEDVVDFVAQPHPDTERDFRCGFAGECG